jgi:hypothetical protein
MFRNSRLSVLVVWCYSFTSSPGVGILAVALSLSRQVVGSGCKVCGPLSALLQAVPHHPPTVSRLLLQALFTESLHWVQLLSSPPFPAQWPFGHLLFQAFFTESSHLSSVLRAPAFSAAYSFSVPCLLFSFFIFVGQGSVCPGCYACISEA